MGITQSIDICKWINITGEGGKIPCTGLQTAHQG